MKSPHDDIIGSKYEFDDGSLIEVIQIRWRGDEDFLVTYHVTQGPSIPRKLVMPLPEFIVTYGYLFGKGDPPETKH